MNWDDVMGMGEGRPLHCRPSDDSDLPKHLDKDPHAQYNPIENGADTGQPTVQQGSNADKWMKKSFLFFYKNLSS